MSTIFSYKAYDDKGTLIKDQLEAETKDEANHKIALLSLHPVWIEERSNGVLSKNISISETFGQNKESLTVVLDFIQGLSELLEANFDIQQALSMLAKQSSKKIKKIASQLEADVSNGLSLGNAMAELKPEFPNDIIGIIKSGEASNSLGDVLSKYHQMEKAKQELQSELRSAFVYPSFVIIVALTVISIIAFTLAPSLVGLFEADNKTAPLLLNWLNSYAEFIRSDAAIYWAIGIFAVSLIYYLLSQSDQSKYQFNLLSRLPFIGSILKDWELAKLSGTLGLLLENKVPLIETLAMCEGATKSTNISSAIKQVKQAVTNGERLSEAFSRHLVFPDMFQSAIKIGEQTNTLASTCSKISQLYGESAKKSGQKLSGALTPTITILIGVLVGSIVLSTMNALLSINELVL